MLQAELTTAELNRDFQFAFAVAQDCNHHFLIWSGVTRQECDQVVHSLDGCFFYGDDDIRTKTNKRVMQVKHPRDFVQAGIGSGTVVDHFSYNHAAKVVGQFERFDGAQIDIETRDAQVAVDHLPVCYQRIGDALCQIRRNRKADAGTAAGAADDLRIDTDNLAVEVDQRTAAIAGIDRGIGLDYAADGEFGQTLNGPGLLR